MSCTASGILLAGLVSVIAANVLPGSDPFIRVVAGPGRPRNLSGRGGWRAAPSPAFYAGLGGIFPGGILLLLGTSLLLGWTVHRRCPRGSDPRRPTGPPSTLKAGVGLIRPGPLGLGLLLASLLGVPTAAQTSLPARGRVYTNAENVRRVALGTRFVAFATSGGVRTWERGTGRWRLWTLNAGLPTDNVYDVAFDPNDPDTLWAIGGDWSYTPRLFLTTLSLATGAVRTEPALSPPAPPLSIRWSLDYRLWVGPRQVVVFAGGRPLALDRTTRAWGPARRPAGTDPRPSLSPLLPRGAALIALRAQTRRIVWVADSGVIFYDRARKRARLVPRPYGGRRQYPVPTFSDPFDLRLDGQSLTYSVLERTEWHNYARGRSFTKRLLLTWRVTPATGFRLAAKRPLDQRRYEQGQRARPARPRPLHGGWFTDFADDGRALWFTTCNQPGIHAAGVARYDVATGRWTYPAAPGGLAANEVWAVGPVRGRVLAGTANGVSLYGPGTDSWRPWRGPAPAVPPPYAGAFLGFLPDPEGRGRSFQIIAREGPRYVWVRWRRDTNPDEPWRLGRVDRLRGTVADLSARPGLAGLSVNGILVQGRRVWLMGEDTAGRPAAGPDRTGPPLLLRWDRDAGLVVPYPTDFLGRYEGLAVVGRSAPGAYFLAAAGTVWLRASYGLFRYDMDADAWRPELKGRTVAYARPFPDALWVREFGGVPGRGAPLMRWRRGDGWQQLALPPQLQPVAASDIYAEGDTFWFSGIGVLRLPGPALRFTPMR